MSCHTGTLRRRDGTYLPGAVRRESDIGRSHGERVANEMRGNGT